MYSHVAVAYKFRNEFGTVLELTTESLHLQFQVTFADYGMYDVLVMVNAFDVGCLNKYSTLKAFVERMEARPNLKKYINSDEYKALVLSPSPRLQLQWTE